MKFYKCDIDKTTKTSQIADIIFNPANEYTGVDFKSFVDYVTHDYGLTFATLHLIARRQTPNDVYWFENDSCSMTTLKRYLTGMDIEEDANLKFIQEIKQEFFFARCSSRTTGSHYPPQKSMFYQNTRQCSY